jgi:hypothetical protein
MNWRHLPAKPESAPARQSGVEVTGCGGGLITRGSSGASDSDMSWTSLEAGTGTDYPATSSSISHSGRKYSLPHLSRTANPASIASWTASLRSVRHGPGCLRRGRIVKRNFTSARWWLRFQPMGWDPAAARREVGVVPARDIQSSAASLDAPCDELSPIPRRCFDWLPVRHTFSPLPPNIHVLHNSSLSILRAVLRDRRFPQREQVMGAGIHGPSRIAATPASSRSPA